MEELVNSIKLHSQLSSNRFAFTRLGIITAYDPNLYAVKARLLPEDSKTPLELGWLPIHSPWVGNGWGMLCPPSPGDVCEIHFLDASLQNGVVSLRNYNAEERALPVPSGEFWLVHKDGAKIQITNDGNITIHSNNTVNVNAQTVNIGDTSGNLKKLLTETAADVFNSHTHPAPNGTTGVPNQQINSGDQTQNTRAT